MIVIISSILITVNRCLSMFHHDFMTNERKCFLFVYFDLITSKKINCIAAPEESLEINCKVSSALVEIVRKINSRPRYIIAKVTAQGSITSSHISLIIFLSYQSSYSYADWLRYFKNLP
jgi:hypothetical protein